jgi:hypothetical protein
MKILYASALLIALLIPSSSSMQAQEVEISPGGVRIEPRPRPGGRRGDDLRREERLRRDERVRRDERERERVRLRCRTEYTTRETPSGRTVREKKSVCR